MAPSRGLEEAWRATALATLRAGIARVASARASPNGLRGWLDTAAFLVVSRANATNVLIARRMWHRRTVNPKTIVSRFARAGLHPPHRYTMALRAAAVGVLLSQGADMIGVEMTLHLSSPQSVYRIVGEAERRRTNRPARNASILAAMRTETVTFGFERYVVPFMPHGTRKWIANLIPHTRS